MIIRREWYQSDDRVSVAFFVKKSNSVQVKFDEKSVLVLGNHAGILINLEID